MVAGRFLRFGYAFPMKEVEFFFWEVQGRAGPRVTTYRMDAQTAQERFPGATPVLSSRKVIEVAETESEISQRAHSINTHPGGKPR